MTPRRGLFVTGTDTGVGKTLVTAALLHALAGLGERVVGMKPVAAGAERVDGVWINEDVQALRAASPVAAPLERVNPYLFREAIAPHIAAEHRGVRIEVPRIVESFEELAAQGGAVLVEGAGGLLVPRGPGRDMADLAIALGLPMLLVVGMRLGCLNHALLTAEAIERRGLRLAGWVANRLDPKMAAYDENLASLAARLPAPLVADLPVMPAADARQASRYFSPHGLTRWWAALPGRQPAD
jgi:dethiobiotin synthetase